MIELVRRRYMELTDFCKGWFRDPDTYDFVLLGPDGHAVLFHDGAEQTWSHRIVCHPTRTPVVAFGHGFDGLLAHLGSYESGR
jgi:hypothetical protein